MSIYNKEKKLPDSRFFISENITPINSAIAFICRELRRAGFLQDSYTVTLPEI